MKKISAFIILFSFAFAIISTYFPLTANASKENPNEPCIYGKGEALNPPCIGSGMSDNGKQVTAGSDDSGWWVNNVLKPFFAWISSVVLGLVSLLTGLAGILLNGVIYHTVINVADNYEKIRSIDVAWRTVRDVGNMGFIFVLLYAAIKTILGIGQDNQKLIVKIVIVAILINFSLFFTRVIIDISNVLALTFYEAIVPGAASKGFDISETGLSQAFTQHLNLTSLYRSSTEGGLTIGGIVTTGVMGSIVLLIAAFSFFAIAIMFIIRYVILILVLILSPIAFLSFVLPEMGKYRTQWWNALYGQAFFAPVYFLLTYITLKILGGLVLGNASGFDGIHQLSSNTGSAAVTNASEGVVATFINFSVVIVFMTASLILSKEWANKTGNGIGKLTNWATGLAGGAVLGSAGWAGRNTIGKAGQMIGDSRRLKDAIEEGGARGMAARLALVAGRKTAGKSFDLRGSLNVGEGKAYKGGYEKMLKDKKEKEKKFAESLGPTEEQKQFAKSMRGKDDADLDPRFMREYEKERARNIERADELESEANEKMAKINANRDKWSPQEIFDAEEEVKHLREQSAQKRVDVQNPQSYIDSIVGVDGKEKEKREKALEKEKEEIVDRATQQHNAHLQSISEVKNNTEKAENDGYEQTQTALKEERERHNKAADKAREEALKGDPALVAEQESQEKIANLEKEIADKEKEISTALIAGSPIQEERKWQIELSKQRLGEMQKEFVGIEERADSRRTAIENVYTKAKEAVKKEYDAREELAQKRHEEFLDKLNKDHEAHTEALKQSHKEFKGEKETEYDKKKREIRDKGAADRRKEAWARSKEKGWVTGKVGTIIEGYADRLDGDSAASSATSNIMRVAARVISHQNRAAAAEIRKGKKSVKDLLEEALKESGEKPKAAEAPVEETPEGEAPPAS